MSSGRGTSKSFHDWPSIQDTVTRQKLQKCMKRTNWTAICNAASRARMSQPCTPRPEYTGGRSSLARLLEFEDGTLWIARIQLEKSSPQSSCRAQIDIDTMAFLRSHTDAPVPRVFAWEVDDQNAADVAFVLLEYLAGKTAYDESRMYNNEALIPLPFQGTFYKSMAKVHVGFDFKILFHLLHSGSELFPQHSCQNNRRY